VDPVERTPTEPADYAALSAIYGALLAGTALSARNRPAIGASELPALAAASFALSKLVVHEKVESWMRRPFVDERRRKPKGRRLRYAVGELLLCTRCTGAWSALGLVTLRVHSPTAGRTVSAVLAASAGNDLLQATFSYLCAHATTEQKRAEDPSLAPRVRQAA
jgi:hypothetical protein